MVLTIPSLALLIALVLLAAQRLISPAVVASLLVINFGLVSWLLPYFARLRSAGPGNGAAHDDAKR
jgi:hypothetical protein